MKRIEETDRHVALTRAQIKIEAELELPEAISCLICLGENALPDTPHMAVKLHFIKDREVQDLIVFQEEPPLAPLRTIGLDAAALLARVGGDSEDRVKEIVDLMANRAYTPIAALEIVQKDHWLDIWLVIGAWEGHHQVKLSSFKKSLNL